MQKKKDEYVLNKIAGFNPYDYIEDAVDAVTNEPLYMKDGSPLRYMTTEGKKLWFRLVYPNGTITSERMPMDNPTCIRYKVSVYKDLNDIMPISVWDHQLTSDAQNFDKNASKCETIALGKALSNAGFGCEIEATLHLGTEGENPKESNFIMATEPVKKAPKPTKDELKDFLDMVEDPKEKALNTVIEVTELAGKRMKDIAGRTIKEVMAEKPDIVTTLLKPNNKAMITSETLEAVKTLQ